MRCDTIGAGVSSTARMFSGGGAASVRPPAPVPHPCFVGSIPSQPQCGAQPSLARSASPAVICDDAMPGNTSAHPPSANCRPARLPAARGTRPTEAAYQSPALFLFLGMIWIGCSEQCAPGTHHGPVALRIDEVLCPEIPCCP